MRKQFVDTVADVMKNDERLVVLLGDIGVHGFREVFINYPKRIYNIGILEASTVSTASGLAMAGLIPVVHTIAPFLVERSYEQLKVDFGYQRLNGNFVSVGGSYDYAALGSTHHCPSDVAILKQIPGMSVIVPGTATEFDLLFRKAYQDPNPTYYRLSETSNTTDQPVVFGKASIIKKGSKATVIAVGPMLDVVREATNDLDVTLLYYTTLAPFDAETLQTAVGKNSKLVICEPYYSGALDWEILEALKLHPISIEHIGIPHQFLTQYGKKEDHDTLLGLTPSDIKSKISNFISQ